MRFLHLIERYVLIVFRALVGVAFLVLIVAVLIQVTGRLTGNSRVWTEELTRFALLYLAAIGAGLSMRTGDLVNVDIVSEAMPERIAWWMRFVSAVLVAGLGLYLLPMAWRYTEIGFFQTSPALGWQMAYVHFTIFLMLALLAFFALLRVVGMIAGTNNGRPDNLNTWQED
ncbi:Tripartite ATP-independent periplasmic transporters, DctQ component [Rhodobacteraceae bacterium THAF1]|uniref:TRAP transporter small permease n=1 Tax=Palleronia sp. THAF1 TaxID=2587842 RepID=UPI000F3D22D8|nr:TRAP transporter small permease subunit [Palleronia sp. THAF1]QFU08836.1 Tripartite ATP-independent periplasmic transporter, DctQ component [Palleronia sp. THAF1]VDC23971.1 Tripartite ATP-independent periplasmic transporters, DctQ component [Rhodobacteraceae bacterium THAF1]